MKPERVRLDATTVSGYHAGGAESLFQYGYSKDDPTLKQVKVMMASLDPMAMPLLTQIVSGNCADDPLYLGVIARARAGPSKAWLAPAVARGTIAPAPRPWMTRAQISHSRSGAAPASNDPIAKTDRLSANSLERLYLSAARPASGITAMKATR